MLNSESSSAADAVTCFLDDSGTDERSLHAVLGGILFDSLRLNEFNGVWTRWLKEKELGQFLHMKSFGRPHGSLAHVQDDSRAELFAKASLLINGYKTYSFAVVISHSEFLDYFSTQAFRKLIGSYGFAFFVACMLNSQIAQRDRRLNGIAYVLDKGHPLSYQASTFHDVLLELQRSREILMGSFRFDDDELVPALQAADLVAWATRRVTSSGSLPQGYEALNPIIQWQVRESGVPIRHFHFVVPRHWIAMFAERIKGWLNSGVTVGSQDWTFLNDLSANKALD